jgi:hypothetical protein
MSKLTKGTHVFFIDPEDGSVIRVKGVTAFNPGSTPADQVETTDLEETVARRYKKGLITPGQASATVQADSAESSHMRLHQLHQLSGGDDDNGPVIHWAVGWSDGTEAPTADSDGFVLPTTRTWFTFDGYVSDFPFDFQLNAVVATALTIQRSGGGSWTKKAA